MKQINNFIFEKLKLNKDINIDNKDIEIKFKEENVEFPDGVVKKIIDYAKNLPIIPDRLEYFYNSNSIRLTYLNTNNHVKYGIVIAYIYGKTQGYTVGYLIAENYSYKEYPNFPKLMTLEECFDYIDKNFDDWIK